MVSASRKAFQELKPEKGGRWKPGSVFVVKHIKDVEDVRGKLERASLGDRAIVACTIKL